ncbi:MAG: alpha/beta fold hydrolase [Deltaproteobacteria bacterium]|nr:alpha/beta fold hydrolase [Deltaproteobacteria bacterium]
MRRLTRILRWLGVAFLAVLGVRAIEAWRAPALAPWHTYATDEPDAAHIDGLDWNGYLRVESGLFDAVRTHVTERLSAAERTPLNRYYDGSPMYPGRLARDWNRSYELLPETPPRGAVVFLHGLTDSPYSLRHLARRYLAHGWAAVAIRLPGHGTVPGALTETTWQDWRAATRLALREAQRLAGAGKPLHVVGYSNGGALAMQAGLDALDDAALPRPTRIILLSPMIGVTRLARFAGVLGWPALLPPFANAAWLSVMPEFNPFKYNSFPVNAARQSSRLASAVQAQIARAAAAGRLDGLAPVQTFQSVADFTVSTRAIVDALYAQLPANHSELVLFDLNRDAKLGPLLRPSYDEKITRLLPALPRRFRTAVLTNAGAGDGSMVERVVEAGAEDEASRRLALTYPPDVYSLSHVSVPFPMTDGLYGLTPDAAEDYGIRLGNVAAHGERNTLVVSVDFLARLASNPFYDYMRERIEAGIPDDAAR